MSLFHQIQKKDIEIPDNFGELKDDLRRNNLKILREMPLRKKLQYVEQFGGFVPWYLRELEIDIEDNLCLLIIFQGRLQNLYNFCIKVRGVPQILIDLWNGITYSREVYEKEHCITFVERCLVYWEDPRMYIIFENNEKVAETACFEGKIELFKKLKIISKDCFHFACLGKQKEIVQYFLDESLLEFNQIKQSLCMFVIYDIDFLKHLIGKGITFPYIELVENAFVAKQLNTVKYLIEERGIVVDIHNLLFAACMGNYEEGIKYLIDKIENIDINNLLLGIAPHGNLNVIKLLIERGANNLDIVLNCAYHANNMEIVKYLIDKGVKPNGILIAMDKKKNKEMIRYLRMKKLMNIDDEL